MITRQDFHRATDYDYNSAFTVQSCETFNSIFGCIFLKHFAPVCYGSLCTFAVPGPNFIELLSTTICLA